MYVNFMNIFYRACRITNKSLDPPIVLIYEHVPRNFCYDHNSQTLN